MNTKILHWLIPYLLITVTLLAQNVEVTEFKSPAEFNRQIARNNAFAWARMPIYTVWINENTQKLVFENEKGKVLKELFLSYEENQRALIYSDYQEAIVYKPKLVYYGKPSPAPQYYISFRVSDIYDSTGELKFSFGDSTSSLKRLNSNFYVTYPDHDYKRGWIYLVNEQGERVRRLQGIDVPRVILRGRNFSTIFDLEMRSLFTFNLDGQLIWKTDLEERVNSTVSLSEKDICVFSLEDIYLLGINGIIKRKISINSTFKDGSLRSAIISKNGRFIFWVNTNRRVADIILPSAEVGYYDLQVGTVVWKIVLPAGNRHYWVPMKVDITSDGKYGLVLFSNGYLFIYDWSGKKMAEMNTGKVISQHHYQLQNKGHSFIFHNSKTDIIKVITIVED